MGPLSRARACGSAGSRSSGSAPQESARASATPAVSSENPHGRPSARDLRRADGPHHDPARRADCPAGHSPSAQLPAHSSPAVEQSLAGKFFWHSDSWCAQQSPHLVIHPAEPSSGPGFVQ